MRLTCSVPIDWRLAFSVLMIVLAVCNLNFCNLDFAIYKKIRDQYTEKRLVT